MRLSNEIVSQFVKATKDENTSTKKESIVYGNITSYDENTKTCYVKIDGSEEVTPITQFTSVVNPNERVTVMIKNHNAVITGNLKTPSVGSTYVEQTVNSKMNSISSISIDFIKSLWEE